MVKIILRRGDWQTNPRISLCGRWSRGNYLATEKYDKSEPVNLGSGMELSIKDLVEMICKLMNFKGEVRWNSSKPDGQPRRRLDTIRAEKEFGFAAETILKSGCKRQFSGGRKRVILEIAKVRPSLARSNLRLYKTTTKPINQSTAKNACGAQKWVDAYMVLTF